MAGRQTFRLLMTGKSGTGKTTLGTRIIRKMDDEKRFSRLVVVNRKTELREFCALSVVVDEDADAEAALKRYKRIHFQVVGLDPRPFLNRLGHALMGYSDLFLVVDEAGEFFEKGRVARPMFRPLTMGRGQGMNVLLMAPAVVNSAGALDPMVRKQMSHYIGLQTSDENELKVIRGFAPEFADAMPFFAKPVDGFAPDYGVKNLDTGRAHLMKRNPKNPKQHLVIELSR